MKQLLAYKRNNFYIKIWFYLTILMVGLFLFQFSNPNRLAHDQIDRKLFQINYKDPSIFKDDYLFGNERRILVDNYFSFKLFAIFGEYIGSDEIAHWLLIPLVFTIFTIGFFELTYYFIKNHLISFAVAIAANLHVPHVFTAEWGLPGPSELDPWVFYQSFLPYLFLMFIHSILKNNKLLLTLTVLIASILGNFHIINAFYFVGTILLAYVFIHKFRIKKVIFAILLGSLGGLTVTPFLLSHYAPGVKSVTRFVPSDEIFEAIRLSAFHVTFSGRLVNAKVWFTNYWYAILPIIIISAITAVIIRRKKIISYQFQIINHFTLNFILAIISLNLLFSLTQIFKFYALNKLPFWNEPRGFQLVYLILYPYLAIFIMYLWQLVKPGLTFQRKILAVIAISFLWLSVVWRFSPQLQGWYRRQVTPGYSFNTCDAQLYRVFNAMPLPSGPVLQDPNAWSAFRICTLRPVIVQNRDRAFAYSIGSDTLLEWHRRYQKVSQAFQVGGNELLDVAQQYGARILVSRSCVEVDPTKLERREKVPGEGCLYVTKPVQPAKPEPPSSGSTAI